MSRYFLLLALVVLSIAQALSASSVTKTVGVTGLYDYHTLNEALTDINANGLADTVALLLMDSTYSEPALIFLPGKSYPVALSILQGGSAQPVVRVTGGGLLNALTIMNRASFTLHDVFIAPDTIDPTKTWSAAVSVSSHDHYSQVDIQNGGVIGGMMVLRGYEVVADSSSSVSIS